MAADVPSWILSHPLLVDRTRDGDEAYTFRSPEGVTVEVEGEGSPEVRFDAFVGHGLEQISLVIGNDGEVVRRVVEWAHEQLSLNGWAAFSATFLTAASVHQGRSPLFKADGSPRTRTNSLGLPFLGRS